MYESYFVKCIKVHFMVHKGGREGKEKRTKDGAHDTTCYQVKEPRGNLQRSWRGTARSRKTRECGSREGRGFQGGGSDVQ